MVDGDSTSGPGWGNVRFDRRPYAGHASSEDAGSARFAIGLATFIIVAVLYPWYSYWATTRLMLSDVTSAATQFAQETDAASARMRSQAAAANGRLQERQQRDRITRVAVRGISGDRGSLVVIVDFGASNLAEATDVFCDQVRRMHAVGAEDALRVQRFLGSTPALPAGTIHCRS